MKLLPSAVRTKIRKLLGGQDVQWCRVVMNQRTAEYVNTLNVREMDALEVSGEHWAKFPFRSYRQASLPEFDICARPLENEKWDIIFVEQVLEHVLFPRAATKNLWQMLRPNGILVVTTPFLIRLHDFPVDCSRWTELGMRHLLMEAGFNSDNIETGAWGNRICLIANLKTWPWYLPPIHSLKNEPLYPLVVWAFARK
jgi:SAM-dependent methyltransferase